MLTRSKAKCPPRKVFHIFFFFKRAIRVAIDDRLFAPFLKSEFLEKCVSPTLENLDRCHHFHGHSGMCA